MKLSIITPVYNGEKFIESCIQNVIDQNCVELEHIIIDGKSTDKTINIIKSYADRYKHIRWISESDQGQSDAMNKAVAIAQGKILGFLNVDDFYEPNVLNRVLEIFRDIMEPSLVVANCNVLDHSGNLDKINKPINLKLSDLLLGFHVNPFPINPSAYFYHHSLHQIIGLYDINEHYVMDVDFLFRAVQKSNVQYFDEIWGNYRMLEGTKTVKSIKSRQSPRRVERVIKLYRKQFPILQQFSLLFKYEFFKKIRLLKRILVKLLSILVDTRAAN